ncbi:MAG: hypothetical protein WA609_11900 [Terriglobales bacterium]
MKNIIFSHFSALVVQMHVHINMYIQTLPPNGQKNTALVNNPAWWLLTLGDSVAERIPNKNGGPC